MGIVMKIRQASSHAKATTECIEIPKKKNCDLWWQLIKINKKILFLFPPEIEATEAYKW